MSRCAYTFSLSQHRSAFIVRKPVGKWDKVGAQRALAKGHMPQMFTTYYFTSRAPPSHMYRLNTLPHVLIHIPNFKATTSNGALSPPDSPWARPMHLCNSIPHAPMQAFHRRGSIHRQHGRWLQALQVGCMGAWAGSWLRCASTEYHIFRRVSHKAEGLFARSLQFGRG